MIAPRTSRTTTSAGDTGWVARVASGIGISVVVAAGIVLSPGGTSAGQDWSDAPSTTPQTRLAPERDGRIGRDLAIKPGGVRLIGTDRTKPLIRPALATPHARPAIELDEHRSLSTPTAGDQVSTIETSEPRRSPIARILTRVRSQLDRWRGVMVTSAIR